MFIKVKNTSRKDAARLGWTVLALAFTAAMIFNPRIVFEGSVTGLKTWWNIVFPSLLPFFIASELLMSFGVVNFMGVLLEPVMRPLFKVPGAGAFVVAVGFTSGYPIGAMLTARLRADGLCTRVEAERLMSFTNNSSPLFMLVAVSVGMFNNPGLGMLIAAAHYLSNLTLGLLLRFYAAGDTERLAEPPVSGRGVVRQAFSKMLQTQRQEKRPAGKIMGDAVKKSVTNLLNIGGFIILFAVLIRLMSAAGIIEIIARALGVFLLPLGFAREILPALGSGFFEMTIGSKLASEAAAPLLQQVVAVGMILAWSGLSVHAQAASMIADTDIRMRPFIFSRICHTCLAGFYTYLACRWAGSLEETAAPVMAAAGLLRDAGVVGFNLKVFFLFILLLTTIITTALLLHTARSLRLYITRIKL
ncbi:sporulation integral membrane protein YlbJ [Pelotomaculum propionicicum]|uniref:Sporulation integral membrane protein YlbJ n=1 Tax=Pelotomaculum propionicicum TaxID=258475 RepID=A0A4Y7RUZ5_9FIRM|nr:sporulation integral membrane protein YlbJ [Pelotomaculum propionicicum]TEB12087.1 Sporulation integral membrane protein YlbJ [Pelotomaculum propionicicum]